MSNLQEKCREIYPTTKCGYMFVDDFKADYRRFQTIVQVCRKYNNSGALNHHLVINNLIVLHNLFGELVVDVITDMASGEELAVIGSFMYFLGFVDESHARNNAIDALLLDFEIRAKSKA